MEETGATEEEVKAAAYEKMREIIDHLVLDLGEFAD